MDAITRSFIERVLPWPAAGEPGVVNLHWFRMDGDRRYQSGRPYIKIDDLIGMSQWAVSQPNLKDQFFCMGRQAKTGKVRNGKVYAARHATDTTHLKSVWLDIDVKDPPKGYATAQDALMALKDFVKTTSIPFPTAIVKSGGGLHVYWTAPSAMTKGEWAPYAEGMRQAATKHGLRFDAGVTTDPSRLLRMPDTFNYKTEPRREVKLVHLDKQDADFSKLPTATPTVTAAVTFTLPPGFECGPNPGFAHLDPMDLLGGGKEDELLNPVPMFVTGGCPFFRETLGDRGKDHAQPLWNLVALASTFWINGNEILHKLSSGHPGYTPAETDAMFDRKLRERTERGLGWPGCASFEREGATQCKTCSHRGNIKTPMHISSQAPPAAYIPPPPTPQQAALHLPRGYQLNDDGIICLQLWKKTKVDGEDVIDSKPDLYPLFYCVLSAPKATEPMGTLNFVTTKSKDDSGPVTIRLVDTYNLNNMMKVLGEQGVKLPPRNASKAAEFFVSWLSELHKLQKAQLSVPFGWLSTKGKRTGFVYGGKQMLNDGTEHTAGYGDHSLREQYAPSGEEKPWFDCLNLVTSQKRPVLETIVATAFGSPLLRMGGTISAWGPSGTNKSSAVILAATVWGHYKLSKVRGDSTRAGLDNRMNQIQCIPVILDDVQTKDFDNVMDNCTYTTEGIGRDRSKPDQTAQRKQTFSCMILQSSNDSFQEHIMQRHKTHDAGLARVFEFKVEEVPPAREGAIDTFVATRMYDELEYNYGMVGLRYAKYLSMNISLVEKIALDETKKFSDIVGRGPDMERFWLALCGSVIAGAIVANKALNTGFNVDGIRQFLVEKFAENRARTRTEERSSAGSTIDMLSGILKHYYDRQIYTGTIPKAGKPSGVKIYYAPRPEYLHHGLAVHWSPDDGWVRISIKNIEDYLNQREIPVSQIFSRIKSALGGKKVKRTLGAGTGIASGLEWVYEIKIEQGHPWFETMWERVPEASVPDKVKELLALREDGPVEPVAVPEAAMAQAQKDLQTVRDHNEIPAS